MPSITDNADTALTWRPDWPDEVLAQCVSNPLAHLQIPAEPFARGVAVWRDAGWLGTLPLASSGKRPRFAGLTGHGGTLATAAKVAGWIQKCPTANLGIWLGFEVAVSGSTFYVAGIDVDDYHDDGKPAKHGREQLEALERQYGQLPATWTSSARSDGFSGIRFYLVPADRKLRDRAAADIEVIDKIHRLAVVWPSVHPSLGTTYHLYAPKQAPDGRRWTLDVPKPESLAKLPSAWVDFLTGDSRHDTEALVEIDRQEVKDFGANHTAEDRPKYLDSILTWLDQKLSATTDRTRKPVLDAVCWAARETRLNYFSWNRAVEAIETRARASYSERGIRFDARDFASIKVFAVKAALSKSIPELKKRSNRERGTDTRKASDGYHQGGFAVRANANADSAGAEEIDEETFWSARPVLTDLRNFARARYVGPYAMLGNALGICVSAIPPNVVLPPLTGSHASLNLFFALVGQSGASKSASMSAAFDWLRVDPMPELSKPGSGEGLSKCYAYTKKINGVSVQCGKNWSILAQIPEVDTLLSTGNRNGSTIMSELRSGWSGERLGFDYAGDDKKLKIKSHRYRLCLTLGVQPQRAEPLFDDSDVGTPQRFLWLPTNDPNRPSDAVKEPGTYKLPAWPITEYGPKNADINQLRADALELDPNPDSYRVLALPQSALDASHARNIANMKDDADNDPLDGHRLLCRLKLAAALMALDQRYDVVTQQDWELAGFLMKVSDATRKKTQLQIRDRKNQDNEQRGEFEGIRADKAEVVKDDRAIKRIRENLLSKLESANNQMSRSDLRKSLNSRVRMFYEQVELELVYSGEIEILESNNAGPDGKIVYRLESGD